MSETEGLREAIARLLCSIGHFGGDVWDEVLDSERLMHLATADAVLALPQVAELRGKVERVEALRAAMNYSNFTHQVLASRLDAALASSPTTHESEAE